MNAQELINSGLLELYVAGACTDEEIVLVEKLIGENPSVAAEVQAIAQTIEQFAQVHTQAPSADLKERIVGSIAGRNSKSDTTTVLPLSDRQDNRSGTSGMSDNHSQEKKDTNWSVYLRAASVGLIIGLLPSMYLILDRQSLSDQLTRVEKELIATKESATSLAARTASIEQSFEDFVLNKFTRVEMPSVGTAADVAATVFWNRETNDVLIDARKLPANASDKDYQLWAIVDGSPVSLGVVDAKTSELSIQKMLPTTGAAMFAITIEPKGGSVSPTLEAMIVAGKV